MRFRLLLLSGALACAPAFAPSALAGDAPVTGSVARQAAPLTLERVFASPSLNGPTPRGVQLSPDGRYLTLLKNRADDRERFDLWGFDRKTGKWSMLVDSLKLSSGRVLSEAEKMQRERQRIGDLKGIVSYDWASDSKAVLVPLDGDLLLAGLDGTVRKIAGTTGGELNPRLGPEGQSIAFVRDRRLWVAPVDGKSAPRAISPEETAGTVHWGEAEFVAQEELARMNGFWWAPDEKRLAVERFDEAAVGVVTRAAIGADGTRTFDQRYPAAGGANADVSLWLMDADGNHRVAVDLGSDKDIYLGRVDWARDGKTLYVQRLDRAQTRLDMLAVDPATGKARVLFTEQAREKSWINLSSNYRFLDDGSLIWWSERDGFGHLYRFKPNGGDAQWQQLTKGDWAVTDLVGVDQKAGRVVFAATRDDVLAGQVYALSLKAPDKIERLTDAAFDNKASMDSKGQTLIVTRSADAQPPQSYLADATGKRLAWIEENKVDAGHPYAPYLAAHRPATFGTIAAADGTPLHYMMITPPLVPGKRYPVFAYHYGGPTANVVHKGWQGALAEAIVAKGYIYFALDNRGSENRGVDFASAIWHAMGTVEVEDQLAGAQWLKTQPYVDPKRVSTFGWSYGGYMTVKMLEAHPGVWAAGIAVAPVTKWELYDTAYTERYLGNPKQVPEVYKAAGALERTSQIRDPLLLVHGMADDNVVFENSTALIAKMQGEAVPFEMMLYPGYTHRISGPKVSQHLYETMFRFLDRNGAGTGK
ncbi:S9 family peptidase [Novosphingobium sp. SG720]|uniref:S9 family peptidase n=1 Tax=Novosphingobium sp. SG720 TaxID=2586998 RepID=UPI0014462AEC|nr:S9 family peptidase [Novosphingobium sp. SG720]NKJ43633.1 dipeptidyl-peptidase-4 [Novosphingobium sp. SG720]